MLLIPHFRQGAKAAQKRERNTDKASKGSKSQAKVNEAAKSIVCGVCKQPFLITTRSPALIEHAEKKHSKTMEDCFPGVPK
ncbi:At2g23090 like protein [Collybia nuda]|uniref:At2g23090 like protein n=1 Tax=Collybia nuda TaxID=64659 RepID=A0A9P5XXK8_9AGAR|nr:At2g23090 like protein [Collybia nuda]